MYVCVYTCKNDMVCGGNLAYLTVNVSSDCGSGIEMPLKYELLEKIIICRGVKSPSNNKI